MKTRTKKKPRRSNPLRYDPTRTGTIRRAFVRLLRKRFARLKGKILRLVVDQDSFGLDPREPFTLNAFCPTGEGGGVDPTCKPKKSSDKATTPKSDERKKMEEHLVRSGMRQEQLDKMKDRDVQDNAKARGYGLPQPSRQPTHAHDLEAVTQAVERARDTDPHTIRFKDGTITIPVGAVRKELHSLSREQQDEAILHYFRSAPLHADGGRSVSLEPLTDLSQADKTSGYPLSDALRMTVGRGDHIGRLRFNPSDSSVSSRITGNASPVVNDRWRFAPNDEKLKQFQAWLRSQFASDLLNATDEELWQRFVEEGFRRGAGRAFDDLRKPLKDGLIQERLGVYGGAKEEFLRSSFAQPETVEKVKLIVGQTFEDLRNVTADMATRMGRILADGLVRGMNPRDLARGLNAELDLGFARSEMIAQTEFIRAHAEAQLDSLERLGVKEVGVAVEWSTAGDGRVCRKCKAMEGVVLKLSEAHSMIPRHVRCRCAFTPSGVGNSDEGQKASRAAIQKAIRKSVKVGGEDDWPGASVSISKNRPESIVNADASADLLAFSRWVANAFCPTGEGGGVDPTCKPGDTIESLQKIASKTRDPVERQKVYDLMQALRQQPPAKATGSHPLDGKDVQSELTRAFDPHGKGTSPAAADNPNPWGYDTKHYPPGVDGKKLATDVSAAVKRQAETNQFRRLSIKDLHEQLGKDVPLFKFQSALAKMQADGHIRLAPYTQARPTLGHDAKYLMPMDREYKFYVEAR